MYEHREKGLTIQIRKDQMKKILEEIQKFLADKWAGLKKKIIKWAIIIIALLIAVIAVGAAIYYFNKDGSRKAADDKKATEEVLPTGDDKKGAEDKTEEAIHAGDDKKNKGGKFIHPPVGSPKTTTVGNAPKQRPPSDESPDQTKEPDSSDVASGSQADELPIKKITGQRKGAVVNLELSGKSGSYRQVLIQGDIGTLNVADTINNNYGGNDGKRDSNLPKDMPEKANRVVDFSNLEAPAGMNLTTDEYMEPNEVVDIFLPKKMKTRLWGHGGKIKVWGYIESKKQWGWKEYDGIDEYIIYRIESYENRIRLELIFKNKTP